MHPAKGLRILVVEDHDFQRRTIARMLRSLGATDVLEAVDGGEALRLLRSADGFDLLLCDLDMPEMDGMELLRHIGEDGGAASVIICSAQDRSLLGSVEKMAQAYGVRLLGAIEKPISLTAIEDLLARRARIQGTPTGSPPTVPLFSLDELLAGLEQGEFEAFFQPKVSLSSGKTVGAEALARWRHPERGIIGPIAFVAILEQSRRLDELTVIMLKQAAEACSQWQAAGMDLCVSVNLSLVSLSDPGFADRIIDTVRAVNLDPHYVMLEITETAAMTDEAPALENLARLRMRGFGLSVDDYGTGFSSLRQLTRVPFTELKIDQSFVKGCSLNASARAIVDSSVEMARQLGIRSVAEGVETQADWDVLKRLGCDLAQGYLIARPMERVAFLEFCLNRDG